MVDETINPVTDCIILKTVGFFTKYIFSKCTQNQLNISKFLPPNRRKTLRSY